MHAQGRRAVPTPEDVRQRGAHDLADDSWIERIVEASGATAGETVLDAGAGFGALTGPLANAVMPGGTVVAIENDPERAKRLRTRDFRGVQVIEGDALQVRLPEKVHAVVANPPFRIIPGLIRRWIEHDVGRIVIVTPRELCDRLVAKPGDERYGKLSVEMGLRGKAEMLFGVAKSAFEPRPEVACALVKIVPKPCDVPFEALGLVLDAAWEGRHQNLRHALAPLARDLRLPPQAVSEALAWSQASQRKFADVAPFEFGLIAKGLAAQLALRDPKDGVSSAGSGSPRSAA
jgi:16S rRNA (adenine1518-N6/adenine1519-N6)-dimethyltransferase